MVPGAIYHELSQKCLVVLLVLKYIEECHKCSGPVALLITEIGILAVALAKKLAQ